MKKIKNHIIHPINVFILFTVMLYGGCTNLDENPIGLLAPESFFKTEADVEMAVLGAYKYFTTEALWGRRYTTALALLDDIHDIGDIGTSVERIQVNNHKIDGANGMIGTFWPVFYQAASAANAAENAASLITVKNQQKINELTAEARMIRAFCYYHLVRLFGDIPYIGEFASDPWAISTVSKTPASEIYQHIIDDCKFGEANLPATYPDNIRCRPTKGAAKTMLASIYLTLGDYASAAQYAEEVINSRASYGYDLMENYTDIWRSNPDGDVKEFIWSIDFYGGIDDDLWGCMTAPRNTTFFGRDGMEGLGGWSVVVPSTGYYGMFDPGDHRIESTFITEALIKFSDGSTEFLPYNEWPQWPRIHFGKYQWAGPRSDAEGRYSGRNYAFFRLAEVYLIAAEALAEVNNSPTPKALEYLNVIRTRARFGGTAPADYQSGMSKQAFIDAVLKERMLEFGGEFNRWWDIARRDLGAEAFGPNGIELPMMLNGVPQRETANPTWGPSKKYLLPIPQSEINKNSNLTQTPGYN